MQLVTDSRVKANPLFPVNACPSTSVLPQGFLEFLRPLHEEFTPWQERSCGYRQAQLRGAALRPVDHFRNHPIHTDASWRLDVPEWAQDQRNQMTGPADDAEMVVKMLNSGAPGVMLDLEDSNKNSWEHTFRGVANAVSALQGELSYHDKKRKTQVTIKDSKTVVFTRVRGLHMQQHGIFPEAVSASVFDLALLVWNLDATKLKHPICVYIPKSEAAEEAILWEHLFTALEKAKGLPDGYIRCMALVESHPMAYRMEEFLFYLRRRIIGLNFGRWDYIASTLHHNQHNRDWMMCDRNAIPHDAAFLQNVRLLMVKICHSRGGLAIGGMTALYPSRKDPAINALALDLTAKDKKNEANCGMDGAWTGHPDVNDIAVAQFPVPNQLHVIPDIDRYVDLRPSPVGLGPITKEGTRSSIRTSILYRLAVLYGKGASLINHRMEDLATDRICRNEVMLRIIHGFHTEAEVEQMYADVLVELLNEPEHNPQPGGESARLLSDAMSLSWQMVKTRSCDPN